MANWHYLRNNQQQGPVPLATLQQMAQSGQLAATDLVWTESMPDWVPASQIPALGMTPQAAGALSYEAPRMGEVVASPRAFEMLRQTQPWVKLLAVLIFIGAAFALLGVCITSAAAVASGNGLVMLVALFYIGGALLYIFPGLYLWRYGSRIGDLLTMRRTEDLDNALEAQKSFWKFMGIVTLVSIGLMVLVMIIGMATGIMVGGSRGMRPATPTSSSPF